MLCETLSCCNRKQRQLLVIRCRKDSKHKMQHGSNVKGLSQVRRFGLTRKECDFSHRRTIIKSISDFRFSGWVYVQELDGHVAKFLSGWYLVCGVFTNDWGSTNFDWSLLFQFSKHLCSLISPEIVLKIHFKAKTIPWATSTVSSPKIVGKYVRPNS